MSKIKILIYTDNTTFGGSEKLMTILIKNILIQENCHILYAYRKHKLYQQALKDEYSIEEQIKFHYPLTILSNGDLFYRLDLTTLNPVFKKSLKLFLFLIENIGLYFVFNLLAQICLIIKTRPDIIHINNGGYPGAAACSTMVVASKLLNHRKIIYQINNTAQTNRNPIRKLYDKFINNNVTFFTTASVYSKSKLVSNRQFDVNKIIQIPNTIIEEPITLPKADLLFRMSIDQLDFLLCSVGHLSESKGQKYLLEAVNLFRINAPEIFKRMRLILIGDGKEMENLKELAISFNITDHVYFLGYKNNSIDYINCCDLFIFPSIRYEDMPLVILMAMRLGKLILATDLAGIQEEIEDRISGILVSQNPRTLAQSLFTEISELYYHRQPSLGENAQKRYGELFSNDKYGQRILNLYESVYKGMN